ncbi:MAG TPA: TIGR03016 family PEP-CTERM system-associated outer membrane protein [Nitrospirota bacterium]
MNGPRFRWLVVILSALYCVAPQNLGASEFRAQTALTVSEEYNDNIYLTPDNMIDDYITTVSPAFHLLYNAPFWDWDVNYRYLYRYYADTIEGADSTHKTDKSHTLSLINRNRIVRDFLFLDIRDTYTRVSLDVTRDFTQESNVVNQSDQNVFSVNPHFVLRPTSQMTVTTGYTYQNTWYKDPTAIDSTDNIGAIDLTQELSTRSSLIAGYKYTDDVNDINGYRRNDVYLGQYYDYADNSRLTGRIGNSWFDFEKTIPTSQLFWDVNFTHRYRTMTIIYDTGLRIIPDPRRVVRREDRYVVSIRRDVERTSLMVSGGMRQYRDVETKHLENTSYRLDGSVSHSMTTASKIILNGSVERLVDERIDDHINRYLTGARYEYAFRDNLTFALDYRWTNVYSPDVYAVNYYNNRYTVELRKSF